jgi:hypothetical protein
MGKITSTPLAASLKTTSHQFSGNCPNDVSTRRYPYLPVLNFFLGHHLWFKTYNAFALTNWLQIKQCFWEIRRQIEYAHFIQVTVKGASDHKAMNFMRSTKAQSFFSN